MAHRPKDWHSEDIKAAIRKSGKTLLALGLEAGLCRSATKVTLIRPWPRVQAIIAEHLGVKPQTIWPSRYDAEGNPRPLKEIIGRAARAPRQKRKAP